jgi:hypothetical protein
MIDPRTPSSLRLVARENLTPIVANWVAYGKSLAADLNGDGLVDAADITVVLAKWGSCE